MKFTTVLLFSTVFLVGCNADLNKTTTEEFKRTITGEAQGTTWRITYYDLKERDFTNQVDSVLKGIDQSISTYLPNSTIDRWNRSEDGSMVDASFVEVLNESWYVYVATKGAFDPTVMPLVSYWGFGPERFKRQEEADQSEINELLALVAFDTLSFDLNGTSYGMDMASDILKKGVDSVFLSKPIPGMKLDFNAIGQGWSVDKVSRFLASEEIKIYFVEIGGEIVAGYPKPDGTLWKFGIDKPIDDAVQRELQASILLRNRGLATSGNYRKFYELNGNKYSHTIDPSNGFPVQHSLLSATVISENAAKSDAYATAFMVMGLDSTLKFIEENSHIGVYVYLLADDREGGYTSYTSKQIHGLIEEIPAHGEN